MTKISFIAFILTLSFVLLQVEIVYLIADNDNSISQIVEHESEGEEKEQRKICGSDEIISKLEFFVFGFVNDCKSCSPSLNGYSFLFYQYPDIPPEFNFAI